MTTLGSRDVSSEKSMSTGGHGEYSYLFIYVILWFNQRRSDTRHLASQPKLPRFRRRRKFRLISRLFLLRFYPLAHAPLYISTLKKQYNLYSITDGSGMIRGSL